jgi:hypothetical protein
MNEIFPDGMEEIFGYLMDLEENINRESEVIKTMLRHIHMNVENTLRKIEVNEHRIIEIAGLVQTISYGDYIDEKQLDAATNLDPEFYSGLDDLYTPIDDLDKKEWEEHIREEKEQSNKEEI